MLRATGEFAHYPAQVSEVGVSVGAAEAAVRKAVATPSVVDTKSWEHVSQMGDLDAVLAHIAASNLQRIDLSRIAWRLRDKEAFRRVVELLGELRTHEFRVPAAEQGPQRGQRPSGRPDGLRLGELAS